MEFEKYLRPFKCFCLVLFFTLGLLFFQIPSFSYAGKPDINYEWNSNYLYNNTDLSLSDFNTWNIRNQSTISDVYNATYSFENEISGSHTALGWIFTFGASQNIEIYSKIYGHSKVVGQMDNSNAESVCQQNFGITRSFGTIEFWCSFSGTASGRKVDLKVCASTGSHSDVNSIIRMAFVGTGATFYYSGGSYAMFTIVSNLWYHIKVSFDSTAGGWDANPENQMSLYVNGIKKGTWGLYNHHDTVNNLCTITYASTGLSTQYNYWDSIGYSWSSNYTIGKNIIPTIISLSDLECDKFEFTIQKHNVINPIGLDNPNGWTDLESTARDDVNIYHLSTNNAGVEILWGGQTDYTIKGLTKTWSDLDSYSYNISWYFQFYTSTINMNAFNNLDVYNNDTVLTTRIQFFNEFTGSSWNHLLRYYDGTSYFNLRSGIKGYTWYKCNFFFNHYNKLGVLRFSNSSISEVYCFPLITSSKAGIGKIDYYIDDYDWQDSLSIRLDYIGIYQSGLSFSTEMGYYFLNLNENWNYQSHNLLFKDVELVNISSVSDSYEIGELEYPIIDFIKYWFNNKYIIISIAHKYISLITNASMLFYVANWYDDYILGHYLTKDFSVDGIQVYGIRVYDDYKDKYYTVSLFQATIDYKYLNFFYEQNNKLYFNLTCTDTTLEYIYILVNVDDVYTLDYTVRVLDNYIDTHYTNLNFTIDYTDYTSTSILQNITIYFNIYHYLLQVKYLTDFIIKISDNDNNLASGSTTQGFLNTVNLHYIENIIVSITTVNILLGIVPLIIIIAPSYILFLKFKSKRLFVGMMGIMSIICFMTNLFSLQMLIFLLIGYLLLILRVES